MSMPRAPKPTVGFVDQYCAYYQALFPEVRSFEQFTALHLGMMTEIPRKTLPAIARAVGVDNAQALHHFLTHSPWQVSALRQKRLDLIKTVLQERSFILCIDETGDKKKGNTTDYVSRQYIGNLGKIENGIVSVNAYGVIDEITFPLVFEVFKPQRRLKKEELYKTKPHIAIELIHTLKQQGFRFEVVLADSLYGESGDFIAALQKLDLQFVVAIRENHGVLMPPGQRLRYTTWSTFDRVFSNGDTETRYIREIIFGQRRAIRYYHITTDVAEQPPESTWLIMTNLAGKIKKTVGNTYGLRTWIEYGFKQSKNELGWADFRLTEYADIEKWWEIVCSAYLMVSLQASAFKSIGFLKSTEKVSALEKAMQRVDQEDKQEKFHQHKWWDQRKGWKNTLNNLRLIIQPYVYYCLLYGWLEVFDLPFLKGGFTRLMTFMNAFTGFVPV
jgi:SRSO17 transposase